jgi:hypothetical protein
MTTKSAAQKNAPEVPTMKIVEKTATEKAAKVIEFKASAEETASEPITEEVKPQEVKAEEVKAEIIAPVQAAPEAKPVQSIEDIKRKSEVLSRLTAKWDSLIEKRKRVENFAISHDGDTASAIIKDAHGEIFESNSPKTISRLIDFCKDEFSEAISIVEKEMREIA